MTALSRRDDAELTLPYRLVVPPGWTRLPAEPDRLRSAVRAMLLRRFAQQPRDATAALRREIEQELVDIARGPGREYLRMLLVLDLQVERRPVTATCLVSLLPQRVDGEPALQQLAASMADGVIESVVEDLGPNRGVVVVRDVRSAAPDVQADARVVAVARRHAAWLTSGDAAEPAIGQADPFPEPLPDDVLAAPRVTRSVDVFLPVPDAPRLLLLSFSTPVEPLFGPLTTLFLTIAGTVQWQRDGQGWS